MRKLHFISGLPRSGSTLLVSILNQNPKFYAGISDSNAEIVSKMIQAFGRAGSGFTMTNNQKRTMIQAVLDAYFCETEKPVLFSTNRNWTSLINALVMVYRQPKFICCVRDIPEILNSLEKMYAKNVLAPYAQTFPQGGDHPNVYERCVSWMDIHRVHESINGLVSLPYTQLSHAYYSQHKNCLLFVEYKDLTKYPEQTMKEIYKFIEEPYFDHDYNNVEVIYDEFDTSVNVKGLHDVRKVISYEENPLIIPKEMIEKFSNLEFWRK